MAEVQHIYLHISMNKEVNIDAPPPSHNKQPLLFKVNNDNNDTAT